MLAEKHYRPLLHFTPAFGWLNDPNGLVYKDGEYHLFYQYYPGDSVWGPMHWGHAVSHDLLSWTHLPIALAPDELGMCFSGTATVDTGDKSGLFGGNDGLLAYYTIAAEKLPEDVDFPQSQGLAYSSDNGRHWTKYSGNPVIPNPGLQDFRDPKVFWYEPGQHWVMVVTLGQQIGIYYSDDAKNWVFSSVFGEGHGAHDERAWECPDLFEINVEGSTDSRWILIVGVQREAYAGGSGTQYFVGRFDGKRFVNDNPPETVLWLDHGRDFYATQTWADIPQSDGRRIALGWMSCWPYANHLPTHSWRSAMSMPHELTLKHTVDGLRLHHAFIRELQTAYADSHQLAGMTLSAPATLFEAEWRSALRLTMTITLAENSSLLLTPLQGTQLMLTVQNNQLVLRCLRQGAWGNEAYDQHFPHDYSLELGMNRTLTLDLLLDRCSAELLLDDGRYAVTNLAFPEEGPQQTLRAELTAGTAQIDAEWHVLTQPCLLSEKTE
ncbi:glycoside hydrolase family 32 protein [Tolumonas osonensis]|uniref:Fructan beta-fructosidase n=1 Tax=Tolumonas osonensis TaxID=675874 RepID=A0A841GLC0_9GAMM|nr:glycoside hydrolase family 32 protein [Tolumonas osonensis]MBB6055951.1 fructan beta-fructosidase [Tolumonas osonensis]